jgi:hypothetical protein
MSQESAKNRMLRYADLGLQLTAAAHTCLAEIGWTSHGTRQSADRLDDVAGRVISALEVYRANRAREREIERQVDERKRRRDEAHEKAGTKLGGAV